LVVAIVREVWVRKVVRLGTVGARRNLIIR
jgi:hypothetical protein